MHWLQEVFYCKARVAKLRPEQGSIASTLWRSANDIEFLNHAIGFANRERPANRDERSHSRGAIRPSCCFAKTLFDREGAGKTGRWPHPWPPRERSARGVDHRFSRDSPAFPAQWFTAYFVLSPVNQRLPPSPARSLWSFAPTWRGMGAPGPHDFAVRVDAARRSAPTRPPHSAPRS